MSFADELRMVHINQILDAKNKRIEELEKIVKGYIFAHAVISKATD
jgi:hypothetical protein